MNQKLQKYRWTSEWQKHLCYKRTSNMDIPNPKGSVLSTEAHMAFSVETIWGVYKYGNELHSSLHSLTLQVSNWQCCSKIASFLVHGYRPRWRLMKRSQFVTNTFSIYFKQWNIVLFSWKSFCSKGDFTFHVERTSGICGTEVLNLGTKKIQFASEKWGRY